MSAASAISAFFAAKKPEESSDQDHITPALNGASTPAGSASVAVAFHSTENALLAAFLKDGGTGKTEGCEGDFSAAGAIPAPVPAKNSEIFNDNAQASDLDAGAIGIGASGATED